VEGTVLDQEEKPVRGATVSTSIPSDNRTRVQTKAQTDAEGCFKLYLARMPSESIDIRVVPPNQQLDEASLDGIRPGARGVIVKLGGMRTVNVLVLDSSGKPVENYGWSLRVDRGDSIVQTGERPGSRPAGRSSIGVPNYPFELEVRAPGFNQKKVGGFPAGILPEVVEVRLDAPKGVEGLVTYQDLPVPECYVELVAQEPDYLDGVLGERWSGLYYGWKGTNARTDAQGRFMIPSDFPPYALLRSRLEGGLR
jgi:hypothetical protein